MKKFILLFILSITFSSCNRTLPYQPAALFSCGYVDSQIDKNTYIINYSGSNSAHTPIVYKYCLIRAAELTKSQGNTYFIIISSETLISSEYSIPSSNMTIRTFKDKPAEGIFFDADDILEQKISDDNKMSS